MFDNLGSEIQVILLLVLIVISTVITVNQIRAGVYAKKSYELSLEMNRDKIRELKTKELQEKSTETDNESSESKFSSRIQNIAKDLE